MAVVSTILLLAFVWSIVLYVLAIVISGRRQEVGLGYSVIGLLLFAVLYIDRLPFGGASDRAFMDAVPGVDRAAATARSPVWPVILVALLYFVRVMVYYELIVPEASRGSEELGPQLRPTSQYTAASVFERANDVVAPPLAFATLTVCLTGLIGLVYRLPWWSLVLIALILQGAYYGAALYRRFWQFVKGFAKIFELAFVAAWMQFRRVFLLFILAIARADVFRRGGASDDAALYSWAQNRMRLVDSEFGARRIRIAEQLGKIFAADSRKG